MYNSSWNWFFEVFMNVFYDFLRAFAMGYLPAAVICMIVWLIARRSAAMSLFRADFISFLLPVIVWLVMYKYDWSLVKDAHNGWEEFILLGWIWGISVLCRLLIPLCTHKIRFRLAAINVGTVCTIAAVLLALFYKWSIL